MRLYLIFLVLILIGCAKSVVQDYESYQVLGDVNAPVTVIEYSDYECPFCKKFTLESLPSIKEEYVNTGKVKFIFKDFPLEIHKNSRSAAVAAHCAGEQGKYFEYHDILFENSKNHSIDNYILWANEIGLATELFKKCMDDPKDIVEMSIVDAKASGVKGTPTFFINDNILVGAQPYAAFKQMIESELHGEYNIEGSSNATCYSDSDCEQPKSFPPYCSITNDKACITTMTPQCKLPGTKDSSCVAIIVEECTQCSCLDGECR